MQDEIREVEAKEVQADELWGFCYCKERNKRNPNNERQGDAWGRFYEATTGNFQLTTDGMAAYPKAVSISLGTRVDYSQLIKIYTGMTEGPTRYSPAKLQGTIIEPWIGNPDRDLI